MSGVADHFAEDDEHAISITRSIVANLNLGTVNNPLYHRANASAAAATKPAAHGGRSSAVGEPAHVEPQREGACGWDEPLFDPAEMGSIIPTDPKQPFDVRKVRE